MGQELATLPSSRKQPDAAGWSSNLADLTNPADLSLKL